jgi:hypothetical protein
MTAQERLVGRLVLRKIPEDVAVDIADRSYAEIVQEIIEIVQARLGHQDVVDLLRPLAGPETRAAMLPSVLPARGLSAATVTQEPQCLHIHSGPYRCHSSEQCPDRWVSPASRVSASAVLLDAVRQYATPTRPVFLMRRGFRCALLVYLKPDGYTFHRAFAWATVEMAQQHGAIRLGALEAAPQYERGGSHWGYRKNDIGYMVHEIPRGAEGSS